ncbi:MAG: hypothetical protein KAW84_00300 [Thermoplasmata archaeon]|nr:hypothetical protein [Thermoplasmata archaeon]
MRENGIVELDTHVACGLSRKCGPVRFIVDTGSVVSSLGEKDVRSLGLSSRDLARYHGRPIVGIGGRTRTRLVKDITIIFGAGEVILADIELLYHMPVREGRKRALGTRDSVRRAPSILGMDLLMALNMALYCHPRKRIAYLERV